MSPAAAIVGLEVTTGVVGATASGAAADGGLAQLAPLERVMHPYWSEPLQKHDCECEAMKKHLWDLLL